MLKVRQLNDLNSCWNSVYRKIFRFNRWESAKVFICCLGRLNLKHIFILDKCRWICKVRRCNDRVVVSDLFWSEMFDVKEDTCLSYFKSSVAVSRCIRDTWNCSF